MFKKKFLILLLLFFLSSCAAKNGSRGRGGNIGPGSDFAGPPASALSLALEKMRLGDRAGAEKDLLFLRKRYKGTTWAARASFVLGLRELQGHGKRAVQYLQEAQALGEIRPYVLLYLARAYHGEAELAGAAKSYTALLEEYPGFAYRGEALYESALVLDEMGRFDEAGIALKGFIGRYPDGGQAGEALLRSARHRLASRDYTGAMENIKTLIVKHPGERFTMQAEKLLKESRRLKPIILTKDEKCLRSQALFDSYFYKETVRSLDSLVGDDPVACEGHAEPLLVETLFRLQRYAEAEVILKKRLKRLRKRHNENRYEERSTLMLLATVYLREDKGSGFLRTVRDLTRKFPASHEARSALFMEGAYYEAEGKRQKAIGIYDHILKDGEASQKAAWHKAWLEYRKGSYLAAYKTLNLYVDKLNSANRRKFAYWRGRALEKAGKKTRAMEEYPKACDSRMPGYYCYLAGRRLGLQGGERKSLGEPWKEAEDFARLSESGLEDGKLRRAMVLLSTGLTREAALEADKVLKAQAPNRDMVFNLMRAFYMAGDYYHAIKLYDSYFGLLTRDNEAISPELLSVAFPIKIVKYISAKGLTGEADPLLVAAVMREESSYDPDTISRTGAVGLMQVMPSTAEFIAQASRSIPADSYDLSDPETNIRMGAWYLAYLWRKTSGNPALTIAGYNAGLNSVRRWQKRFPLEDDEFIESIPFRETRNYTKKVLKSYEAFQMLAVGRRPLLAYDPLTKAPSE